MTTTLTLVVYMAILTWVLLLIASLCRVKGWTFPGLKLAMGNRAHLPEGSSFAGRAARTAHNTLENFVLFAALALVAHAAGASGQRLDSGAMLFFWARVVYVPVYYAGIPGLRTVVWAASVVGLVMMITAML